MLELRCDICRKQLQEPGGLLFSPPVKDGWVVEKYHVCVDCWPRVAAMVKDDSEASESN
jgi:hypothetical protein